MTAPPDPADQDVGITQGAAAERDCQQLWLALSQRAWSTIVIVPAHPGGSSAALATALADVGKRLSGDPVRAITLSAVDYETARALADMQEDVERDRRRTRKRAQRLVEVGAAIVAPVGEEDGQPRAGGAPFALAPSGRVIISIPAVVGDPLGVAIAQGADAVVVSLELGRTRRADARRTIELIGRERVVGCFLLT